MKISLVIFLSLLFFSSISFSQSNSEEKAAATSVQPMDPCDWALLFKWHPFDVGKYYISEIPDQNTNNEPIRSIGIGAEKYLGNYSSIYGGLSLGINSSTTPNPGGEQEFSSTEIGVKLGYNWYPKGIDARISPFFGPWASYATYSQTDTFTPITGNSTENEFSSSAIGIGITGGVYVQFWEDIDFDLGVQYNLGAMIYPSSTITRPGGENGASVETDGPSGTTIGDCGGSVTARFSF